MQPSPVAHWMIKIQEAGFPIRKFLLNRHLRCYTVNNAWAGFQENKTGMLKTGMLADFTVLSEDLFSIAPENIRDTKILLTVVGGKEAYSIMGYGL